MRSQFLLGLGRKVLRRCRPLLSDKLYIKCYYYCKMGRCLHIDTPQTFNEKLQWLKFNNRHPEYSIMVDKYAVKDYVARIIGEEHIIPTIALFNTIEDIDYKLLPNQFALKCTHDSGGVVICKDKTSFNKSAALAKLKCGFNKNYYRYSMEYPYKYVKPRIIAEQFLSNNGNELCDYKIHCFNGEPKLILVCKDRFSKNGMTEDFFTSNWVHLDVCRPGHANSSVPIPAPQQLPTLLEISRKLSRDIPFVRVDLYITQNKIFFGELTFFPASGMTPFIPDFYDYLFGSWLKLPIN